MLTYAHVRSRMRQATEAPRGGLASDRERAEEGARGGGGGGGGGAGGGGGGGKETASHMEMQYEWFLDFLCEISKEGVVGDLVRESSFRLFLSCT